MIEQSRVVDLDRAANGRVVDGREVNFGALLDGDILGQSGARARWRHLRPWRLTGVGDVGAHAEI